MRKLRPVIIQSLWKSYTPTTNTWVWDSNQIICVNSSQPAEKAALISDEQM